MEFSTTSATPAATAAHNASAVTAAVTQDPRANADSSAKEALPDRPPRVGFQEDQPVPIRSIKNTIAERRQPERQDSCERFQLTFQQRRSNTGWSVASGLTAASTATDITEPESPDPSDEGTFDVESALASSPPRPHTSLSRPVACASSPTKPLASIDYDRSFSSRQRQRINDVMSSPRRIHSDRPSRRSSTHIPHPLPIEEDVGSTTDGARDGDSSSSGGWPGQKYGDKSENAYATEVVPIQEEDELSSGGDGGFPLTPGDFHSSTDENTPDSLSEAEHGTTREVDDSLVQDFLDRALKHVFGVELCELSQGTASAAYQSVSYCLDELSYIVRSGSQHFIATAAPSVNEAARGHAGSSNTHVQAAFDATGYGGASNGQSSRKNHSGTKKRLSGGLEGGEEDEEGDGDDGDGRQGGGKRQKVADHSHSQNFSCPFRKRNPIRFNVRDFQSCAVQSFPDIPQLKRHIKNFHRQNSIPPYMCPRCKEDMGSHMDLLAHSAVEIQFMCEVRDVPSSLDPEDGITPQVEEVLNGRKANSKVDGWNTLWEVLFGTEQIPDHNFVPPTELDEVHTEFRKPASCDELRQRLAAECPLYDTELLLGLFNEHVDSVVDTCRSRTGQMSGRPRRTRNQGPRQPTASPQRARRASYTASIHRIQSGDTLGSNGRSGGASSTHGTPINNDSSWPSPNQPLMPYAPSPGGYGQAISPGGLSDSNVTSLLTVQASRRQPGITVPAPTARQPQRPVFAAPLLETPGGADPTGSHHMRVPSGDSGISFDTTAAAGYLLQQQPSANLVPNHFLASTNLPVRQQFRHAPGRGGGFTGGGSMNPLSLDMNQVYQQQMTYQHRMQHPQQLQPQQLQMQGQGQSPISPHSAMTVTASSPGGFFGSYEMGLGETSPGQYPHQH